MENLALKYFRSDAKFDFGKYKGASLEEVVVDDPSYINFCCSTVHEFRIVKETLVYLIFRNIKFELTKDALIAIIVKNSSLINSGIGFWSAGKLKNVQQINKKGATASLAKDKDGGIISFAKYIKNANFENLDQLVYDKFTERISLNMPIANDCDKIKASMFEISYDEYSCLFKWMNESAKVVNAERLQSNYMYWYQYPNHDSTRSVIFIETMSSEKFSGILILADYSQSFYSNDRKEILSNEQGVYYEKRAGYEYELDYKQAKSTSIPYHNYFTGFEELDAISLEEKNDNDKIILENIAYNEGVNAYNSKSLAGWRKFKAGEMIQVSSYKPSRRLREEFWLSVILNSLTVDKLNDFGLGELKIINSNVIVSYDSDYCFYDVLLSENNIDSICKSLTVKIAEGRNKKSITLFEAIEKDFRECKFKSFLSIIGMKKKVVAEYDRRDAWEDAWDAMTDGQYGSYRGGRDYEGIGF